jgi:pimeloyl-ACP methyl ester carboxylesterase
VASLANLEGFGLPARLLADAPGRYAKWLAQARAAETSSPTQGFRSYPDFSALAERLAADNPRLTSAQAAFLASHLGVQKVGGKGETVIQLAIDPCHRWASPLPYSVQDAMAIWRQVRAPVLWLRGAESAFVRSLLARAADQVDDYQARMACFGHLREVVIPDAGHNMHHDQAQKVAQCLTAFFAREN